MGKSIFWLWRLKYVLLVLVLLVLLGISILISTAWLSGDNTEQESEAFVEQIRDMSSLATSQAYVKAVIEQTDNQFFGQNISINLPGTQRRLLLVVPGTVLAGVDLEKITEDDVRLDAEAQKIEITIPRSTLLQDPAIDLGNIQAFSVEGLFRSNVNWEEGFEIAAQAQDMIKEEATDQGLLSQADKNAERVLSEFFKLAGYEATILFEDE
ncbi:DUF4230 domain-containing protein [Jeotgalibacillus sp. S-D1]|uniref:DUF4230 domain-containing protein n=1 Tax=Jeotgalibacillus sp. S-D1 TaxID=2552189 RepID=UPI001404766E|nr:DUF4230 domain-containing protein [Jeotgalibacillus sp. S-D1]